MDIDENTSITHCLKCYSNTETLCADNKFKCDKCNSYQEAQVSGIIFFTFFMASKSYIDSFYSFSEMYEGKEITDDFGSTFKTIQIR